jgi:hypothetical protein
MKTPLLAAALTLLFSPLVAAGEDGGWRWDLRYRFEQVDDKAFDRDANAHTLRLRLGYLWAPRPNWSLYLEGEHVEAFGRSYNSTANGRSAFPIVADPESTEINQAWVAWQGESLKATVGRQRILLDNQRFVGNVGWRQNEQTYDALALHWKASADIDLRYHYIDRVHRVFSDRALNPLLAERDHDSHLINLGWGLARGQRLTGYAYLLQDRSLPADSSATWGLRWSGQRELGEAALHWALEYAKQGDHGNQPADFSLDYWLIEPKLAWRNLTWTAGWERLGGNGQRGFATPLATLHAFNGWADRFLATPANGLEDRYLGVAGSVGKARWNLVWHDYAAARGGASQGNEWNASLAVPVPGRWPLQALVKLADYRGDGFAADVRKLWIQLEWKGP